MRFSAQTERLTLAAWPERTPEDDLRALRQMLTPPVLAPLPPQLHEKGDMAAWIAARQAVSSVIGLRARADGALLGLLQVMDAGDGPGGKEYRLGYMLAEAAWGKGYATEAARAVMADLAKRAPCTVHAGAERDNIASIRVLEKSGFTCVPDPNDPDGVTCHCVIAGGDG